MIGFSFQCVAHFLHLCMIAALKIETVQELVGKVREWVKECRTKNGRNILHRHQEKEGIQKCQLILVYFFFINNLRIIK